MRVLIIAAVLALAACSTASNGQTDEHAERCHHATVGCAYTN